jgi:PAS domain S-box-containing protein
MRRIGVQHIRRYQRVVHLIQAVGEITFAAQTQAGFRVIRARRGEITAEQIIVTGFVGTIGSIVFIAVGGAYIERVQRTHEALQWSEASYRAIFEAAEDAILVHDWDTGTVLDVNAKACERYGYSAADMRGISLAEVSAGVAPYTHEQALHYIALAKSGHCPPFEWHRRNRDGSLHSPGT